jgi:hypothetical protein
MTLGRVHERPLPARQPLSGACNESHAVRTVETASAIASVWDIRCLSVLVRSPSEEPGAGCEDRLRACLYGRVNGQGFGGALEIDAHRGGVKSDLFYNEPECEPEREIAWRDQAIWTCRAHIPEEDVGVNECRRGTERR